MNEILPDLILRRRQNQTWQYSGIDSRENCCDLDHFLNYPKYIDYQYNSRGFRDQEWPNRIEDLVNAIWCIGDSFTVGIGVPFEHTWFQILQQQSGQRCINISLDGASNDWIARRTSQIIQAVNPQNIVIHWSFIERRENSNTVLLDEERRNQEKYESELDNVENLRKNIELVDKSNIIHSTIPNFSGYKATKMHALKTLVKKGSVVPYFDTIDYARDGLHYDQQTANFFVDQILNFLNNK